ncbi:MAG: leucine-rich repeat domain-containing protein [Candidatus Lokiarchaeota archaeon]|nr:leucine-rich repeat domain-containing protein [Candidatus Lokiarchaeota archaeon]
MIEIPSLEKFKKVKILKLDNNKIRQIAGLDKLTSLEELYLAHNKIESIEGLDSLAKLRTLDLKMNWIKDVNGMENLHSLREVYLGLNKIPDAMIESLGGINPDDSMKDPEKVRLFCAIRKDDTKFKKEGRYAEIGWVNATLGNADKAIIMFRKALEKNDKDWLSWRGLGAQLFMKGRKDEGIDAVKKAIEIRPDDPDLWHRLSGMQFYAQQFDEAVAAIERAISFNPIDNTYKKALGIMALARAKAGGNKEIIIKEIVFIRCRYCKEKYEESKPVCPHCGGSN